MVGKLISLPDNTPEEIGLKIQLSLTLGSHPNAYADQKLWAARYLLNQNQADLKEKAIDIFYQVACTQTPYGCEYHHILFAAQELKPLNPLLAKEALIKIVKNSKTFSGPQGFWDQYGFKAAKTLYEFNEKEGVSLFLSVGKDLSRNVSDRLKATEYLIESDPESAAKILFGIVINSRNYIHDNYESIEHRFMTLEKLIKLNPESGKYALKQIANEDLDNYRFLQKRHLNILKSHKLLATKLITDL
jgi:hypothetical protein